MDPMYHPTTHVRVRGRRPAAENDDNPTSVSIAESKGKTTSTASDVDIADKHGTLLIVISLMLVLLVLVLAGLVLSGKV